MFRPVTVAAVATLGRRVRRRCLNLDVGIAAVLDDRYGGADGGRDEYHAAADYANRSLGR